MKSGFYTQARWRRALSAALLTTALLTSTTAFGWQGAAAPAPKPASTLTAAERETGERVKVETIREVTTTLASREMEGRGTAQPGADRAAKYLADRLAKLNFKPLGDAGTYLQAIKFRSTQVLPESSVKSGDATLKFGDEFVVPPPYATERADATGEVIFVGYGLVSNELKRDDLAGLDVKGKIVMLLNGRPTNVDKDAWAKAANPQAVFGNLLLRGVAGVIVTNIGTKQQPYPLIAGYLSRRNVTLASTPQPPFAFPPLLLVSTGGAEKLFAGSGMTYAQALAKAESGEFASRSLNKTAEIALRLKREEGTSSNVVGVLEGSDPELKKQAVVYTAHYDAYGKGRDGRVYHGAADNALGVGMILSMAEAFAKLPERPRRSIVVLAVTGEEYGLFGSQYWVAHPTWPIENVVANLNFDGMGTEVYGPVRGVIGLGAEHSDLGAVFEGVLAASGLRVAPDPMPDENLFMRSDHFPFVKRGVPAMSFIGVPEGDAWVARVKHWLETDYHQPEDNITPDWNWDGPRTLAAAGFLIGLRVASADAAPAWLPTSPFKKG